MFALDRDDLGRQTIEIGGPEFLSIHQVVEQVMAATGITRYLWHLRPSYMRMVAVLLEYLFPNFPHSINWIDYLANDRITELDSVNRIFGLLPARMAVSLDHLTGKRWGRIARQEIRRRDTSKPLDLNW